MKLVLQYRLIQYFKRIANVAMPPGKHQQNKLLYAFNRTKIPIGIKLSNTTIILLIIAAININ